MEVVTEVETGVVLWLLEVIPVKLVADEVVANEVLAVDLTVVR
jgi:hypothetical protein